MFYRTCAPLVSRLTEAQRDRGAGDIGRSDIRSDRIRAIVLRDTGSTEKEIKREKETGAVVIQKEKEEEKKIERQQERYN